MNNKKCHYCGFINFADAEVCRKCEAVLAEAAGPSIYDRPASYCGGVNTNAVPYKTKSGFTSRKLLVCIVGMVIGAVVYSWLIRPRVLGFFGYARVNWIEFHPDGLDFTVMMPNQPTALEPVLTPLPSGRMSTHNFISTVSGQGVAMFAYTDYTGPVIDPSQSPQALDTTLQELLTHMKSTLVSKKSITYQGMPGLEFEVTPPGNDATKSSRSYGKLFFNFNSGRLFVLSITANPNSDLFAGKDKFLNPTIPMPPPIRKLGADVPSPKFIEAPVYQPSADDFK